jgi:hypothetical protein
MIQSVHAYGSSWDCIKINGSSEIINVQIVHCLAVYFKNLIWRAIFSSGNRQYNVMCTAPHLRMRNPTATTQPVYVVYEIRPCILLRNFRITLASANNVALMDGSPVSLSSILGSEWSFHARASIRGRFIINYTTQISLLYSRTSLYSWLKNN